MDAVFVVIEPSGKRCELFPDGTIRGFESGSAVFNRYQRMEALAVSRALSSPTCNETSSETGQSHFQKASARDESLS